MNMAFQKRVLDAYVITKRRASVINLEFPLGPYKYSAQDNTRDYDSLLTLLWLKKWIT